MRRKIRCDGWKRKYFGFAWEVNEANIFFSQINQSVVADFETAYPEIFSSWPRLVTRFGVVDWAAASEYCSILLFCENNCPTLN
jgi:hypothetical protein